jgi:hypothetical protein
MRWAASAPVKPEEAGIRRKAYELFMQLRRKGQVAKELNAAGYRTRDELIRAAVANRSKISEMTKLIAAHNNKLAESAAKRNATKAAKAAAPIVAAPVK